MPELGPLVAGIAELIAPLLGTAFGAFVRTSAGMVLLGVGAAVLSARIASTGSPVRELLGVAVTIVVFAVLGGIVAVKRAVGATLIEGLARFRLGRRVTDLLFAQMLGVDAAAAQGERGVALARTLERLPLAEAEARLSGAVKTLTRGEPGAQQRWLARVIARQLLAAVERLTLARFRDQARATGGVDLLRVQEELREWIDARLADSLRAKLNALSFGLASIACALSLAAAWGIRRLP